MFGSAYRTLTNLAVATENLSKAGAVTTEVLVDLAEDWRDDARFERDALAATRKAALAKIVADKKKQLGTKVP